MFQYKLTLNLRNNIFKFSKPFPMILENSVPQNKNSYSLKYGAETISYLAPKI